MDRYDTFPKAKYELSMDRNIMYYFVTTSISPEECLDIMIEKGRSLGYHAARSRFLVYETINGERKLIHDEKKERISQPKDK